MKNLGIRIFAFMLVVWYSLSIIGFGVHTCSESNRSFLTNFISGVSCEDIHPTDICSDSCCAKPVEKSACKCCHEHQKSQDCTSDAPVKLTSKTCCSNEYQQIDITGSGQSYEADHNLIPICSAICYVSSFIDNPLSYSKLTQVRSLPGQIISMGELRPLLSVWRI